MKNSLRRSTAVSVLALLGTLILAPGCTLFKRNEGSSSLKESSDKDSYGDKAFDIAKRSGVTGLFVQWTLEEAVDRLSEGTVSLQQNKIRTNQHPEVELPGAPSDFASWGAALANYRKFRLKMFGTADIANTTSLIPVLAVSHSYSSKGYLFKDEALKKVAVVFDISLLKQWEEQDFVNPHGVYRGGFNEQFSASFTHQPQRLQQYIQNAGEFGGLSTEYVMVDRPLPLRFATSIWLHPNSRANFDSLIDSRIGENNPQLAQKLKGMIQATDIVVQPYKLKQEASVSQTHLDSCETTVRAEATIYGLTELKLQNPEITDLSIDARSVEPLTGHGVSEVRAYFAFVQDAGSEKNHKIKVTTIYEVAAMNCKVTEIRLTTLESK